MPEVDVNYNRGGEDAQPNQGNPNDLATVLRALIDDNGRASVIASADASDLGTAITLVNEIKAALNVALTATKV